MKDKVHLIRDGCQAGPGLMQRPGEAGGSSGRGIARYGAKRRRQRNGRAALPDARARASKTARQSASELVSEAPRMQKRPQTWRTWVVYSNDVALVYGGSLHARLIYGRAHRNASACRRPSARSPPHLSAILVRQPAAADRAEAAGFHRKSHATVSLHEPVHGHLKQPARYLSAFERAGVGRDRLTELLREHLVDADLLRSQRFAEFLHDRATKLARLATEATSDPRI